MTKKYKCIELFCGAGGLGLGLEKAGFEILSAFDLDKWAVKTYQENLSPKCEVADVKEISGTDLCESLGLEKGELDLIAGGPPCQGFSKQRRGAHLKVDERNRLVFEYVRIAKDLMPKFFLIENVAMFGQKRGREFLQVIGTEMKEYDLVAHFYNSADYGLAQTRQRYIIVGKRKDLKQEFQVPNPTVKEWKTVGEVLGDLPEPPYDYTEHPVFYNHQRARVSELNIKRFSFVPQGGGWKDIPEEFRLECHKNVAVEKGGWPDVYGRLIWDGQAPTITGGFDSFTRGRYGHPKENRPLTPREAARLQGFPDKFRFFGTRQDVRRQIGNAVPPPLAKAIGKSIIKTMGEK